MGLAAARLLRLALNPIPEAVEGALQEVRDNHLDGLALKLHRLRESDRLILKSPLSPLTAGIE
jgi:hypothetical protein